MDNNSVEDCLEFFQVLRPDPTQQHAQVQIGCHFEEVAEMMDAITALDEDAGMMLANARDAVHALAEHLKKSGEDVIRIDDDMRVEFLDAACDQMVTAIGSCHMLKMDVVGGFCEVNQSNLSKFGEDGQPVFDVNGKGAKGPNYRKAELEPFV